jgi:hypothetical protein
VAAGYAVPAGILDKQCPAWGKWVSLFFDYRRVVELTISAAGLYNICNQLSIESQPGHGTTIEIHLPV